MINVLLPSMGSSSFFKESFFPKPLIEVNGRTILESVFDNFNSLSERQFIYVFSQNDCSQFHLDKSVRLLDEKAKVLLLKNQTAGALCTSLIACEFIDNDTPLIISNSDQVIDVDFNQVVKFFNENNADSGVIVFNSIHPRWSYISEENGEIVEVAEKRPLSDKAIAGFYYYKKGSDFVSAAKIAIQKGHCTDGKYYISSSLNELILMNKKICFYEIEKKQYHSFYSPEKIKDYEKKDK